jgi:molybdopterin/thiamine biosynthesis adenylyltransferase/rhodanese-related sulfurtransferase
MTLTAQEKKRYSRHLLLSEIGVSGQEKLKKSKVLVIGAGGLGCPVLQYISAAGVGHIGIVDFDKVDESNLQRQILYSTSDVGTNKAKAAKNRLNALNPLIEVSAYEYKLTNKNALGLFSQYDIIVDGSDNFSTRYLVNDASIITGKTLVYGAIHKFEGQVTVFNFKQGPSYRCLFPEAPTPGSAPSCSETGVLGVLPGIVGVYQANEVLKIILGIGNVLSGKLLLVDALNNSNLELNIEKSPQQINKVLTAKNEFESYDYDFFCGIEPETKKEVNDTISSVELSELITSETVQIIDVREEWESPKFGELNAINIPLNTLDNNLHKIKKNIKTIVYCQKGGRSTQAIKYLHENGFDNLINLQGGISSY